MTSKRKGDLAFGNFQSKSYDFIASGMGNVNFWASPLIILIFLFCYYCFEAIIEQ